MAELQAPYDVELSRARILAWAAVWTLVAAAACSLYQPASMPLLSDSQHYFFIAERAASGYPPHASHFDPKNMLAMLITAESIFIGRFAGVEDLMSARVASIAATGACAGLAWLLAWRLSGRVMTAHFAAAAMATVDDFLLMGAIGAQPKTFLTLLVFPVLLAGFRRRPWLSGVAVAAAFLSWQPAAILLVAAAAPLLLEPRRTSGLLALLAGFVAPVLLYEAYFWTSGALGEQLTQAYVFPLRFMGAGLPSVSGVLRHAAWVARLKDGPIPASVVPASFALALALGWIFALARPRTSAAWLARNRGALTFVVAAHALPPFVLWNYQGFPDRFILLPVMTVAAALLWTLPLFLRSKHELQRTAAATLVGGVALLLAARPLVHASSARYGAPLSTQLSLAREVRAMLDRGRSVWAIGCTHLLAFNHANNFVSYGFFLRGLTHYLDSRHGAQPFAEPVFGAPDVVLVSRRAPATLQAWLTAHYEESPRVSFAEQKIQVWRRRGVKL